MLVLIVYTTTFTAFLVDDMSDELDLATPRPKKLRSQDSHPSPFNDRLTKQGKLDSSLNVNGIRNKIKREKIFHYLKQKTYDFVYLQETHCANESEASLWAKLWERKMIWNKGSSQSRGNKCNHIIGGDFNCTFDNSLDREGAATVDVKADEGCQELKALCNKLYLEDVWRQRNQGTKCFTFIRNNAKTLQKVLMTKLNNEKLYHQYTIEIKINTEKVAHGPGLWMFNT
ncbi:hypothetical protein MAR_035681, partial [Mya arenaria]